VACMGNRTFGAEELTAVGKRIRSKVQNSHNRWEVKTDGLTV
jgi:hypothetical protein